MGWRGICRSTDERTVVGGLLPRMGIGNNLPIWHPRYEIGARSVAVLVALLSSTTLDYAARQKVAGSNFNSSTPNNSPSSPPINSPRLTSPLSPHPCWN